MKNSVFKLLVMMLLLLSGLPGQVKAAQEIKEINILSGYLGDIFNFNRKILKYSHLMQEQARPFGNPRHRARYRFEPKDDHARAIMILSRRIASRFKMVNGMLYHSEMPNRLMTFRQALETSESMVTFAKRSIRAISDGNYALYLASAQGIEKEVFALNELIASLEGAINAVIEESDSVKESL